MERKKYTTTIVIKEKENSRKESQKVTPSQKWPEKETIDNRQQ